ncbi:hypothetical protein AB5J62_29560 [Amycolatopsis sp. cg5]|uniref:hypothetical protein n=1 Tax=Amycolatopsis sp. cg5 TaxID=3238802 RepID=UPI0035243660
MSAQQPTLEALRLGHRIREARERARPVDGSKPTQQWLARQFTPERTPQQISTFEMGRNIPAVSVLVELYEILHGPLTDREPNAEEFAEWLVGWTSAKSSTDATAPSALLSDALRLLENPDRHREARRVPDGPLRSLADFPGNDPLTVILGDRRESRAKSAADCLIYSGSATDAMSINLLGGHMDHTVIRSDKLLVRMPQDYLESMPELAKSNLLVIGSPAANWGARILNKDDAIFSFRIDEDVVARDETLRADDRMQDERFASVFGDLLRRSHHGDGMTTLDEDERQLIAGAEALAQTVLDGSTAKAMMNKFRSLGILDPADQEHHAQFTYGSNDFAVVTMARNPWCADGRYRAVICGGIHGPGTAWALRELLTNPERFANRPLGAVLEVKLRLDLDWPTRFEKATGFFQTREYTVEDVLENLEIAGGRDRDARKPVFRLMSKESLVSRAAFVRDILGS